MVNIYHLLPPRRCAKIGIVIAIVIASAPGRRLTSGEKRQIWYHKQTAATTKNSYSPSSYFPSTNAQLNIQHTWCQREKFSQLKMSSSFCPQKS